MFRPGKRHGGLRGAEARASPPVRLPGAGFYRSLGNLSLSLSAPAGHGRAHGRTHVTTPRHACPAVGGPETGGHAEIRLSRDRRPRQQMQQRIRACLSSAPALPCSAALAASAPPPPAVRPTTSSRTHPPSACEILRERVMKRWSALRRSVRIADCSTIALVSCHRPRSVWVCVLCPAPEAARWVAWG